MTLVVENLSKKFIDRSGLEFIAVQNVSFELPTGQVATLVGPSGCGKSTILKALAGLLDYEGVASLDGNEIRGPSHERAMVFQGASLLPWRSVAGNIRYGMELQRHFSASEMRERVDWAVRLVGLERFVEYYPSEISGGMQQRVNLARALVVGASLILMDEPFGALDAMTREKMQEDLMEICSKTQQSIVFVTHDINEAVYLGDEIIAMGTGPGRIVQVMTFDEPRPRSRIIESSSQFQEMCETLRVLLRY